LYPPEAPCPGSLTTEPLRLPITLGGSQLIRPHFLHCLSPKSSRPIVSYVATCFVALSTQKWRLILFMSYLIVPLACPFLHICILSHLWPLYSIGQQLHNGRAKTTHPCNYHRHICKQPLGLNVGLFTDKGVLGVAISRVAGPDSIASLSRERQHHACRAVTIVADCPILWRRHPTIQIRLFPVRRSHV
jgi:hypothetical protein